MPKGDAMVAFWIFVGSAMLVIALVLVYALITMASSVDREMRHDEKRLDPLSDVFVTQTGQDIGR
jgi:hypothetical protein